MREGVTKRERVEGERMVTREEGMREIEWQRERGGNERESGERDSIAMREKGPHVRHPDPHLPPEREIQREK